MGLASNWENKQHIAASAQKISPHLRLFLPASEETSGVCDYTLVHKVLSITLNGPDHVGE